MQAGGGGESRYLDILVTVADGSQGDRADSVLAGDAWMLVAFWPIPASVPALRSIMASTRQHPGVSDVICDRGAGRVGGGRGGSSADRFGSECGQSGRSQSDDRCGGGGRRRGIGGTRGAVRRACPGVSGGGGAGSGVSRAVCAPIERGSDIVCGYRGDHRDVAPGGRWARRPRPFPTGSKRSSMVRFTRPASNGSTARSARRSPRLSMRRQTCCSAAI
ncbi:Uncharacterised protein [Mycobacterium tuberculosis]|nr:Uncharacterised protein [Mycobacterium tuberculosis]CLY57699.1 Uncharacterised protein [Mycobacterium tuberculosis]